MFEACLLCIKTNNVIKDAISKGEVIFESADMLNNLFILIGLLKKFINLISNDLIRDLLEIITIYFISSRQFNMEITMAFTKKITILIPYIENENVAFSFMLLLNKLFGMYPFLRDLLDKSEEDYFNDKTNDVNLSNGKNANCLKDLQQISNKSEKLKNFVNDLINKKNSSAKYMMNYYDVLLSDKNKVLV